MAIDLPNQVNVAKCLALTDRVEEAKIIYVHLGGQAPGHFRDRVALGDLARLVIVGLGRRTAALPVRAEI